MNKSVFSDIEFLLLKLSDPIINYLHESELEKKHLYFYSLYFDCPQLQSSTQTELQELLLQLESTCKNLSYDIDDLTDCCSPHCSTTFCRDKSTAEKQQIKDDIQKLIIKSNLLIQEHLKKCLESIHHQNLILPIDMINIPSEQSLFVDDYKEALEKLIKNEISLEQAEQSLLC